MRAPRAAAASIAASSQSTRPSGRHWCWTTPIRSGGSSERWTRASEGGGAAGPSITLMLVTGTASHRDSWPVLGVVRLPGRGRKETDLGSGCERRQYERRRPEGVGRTGPHPVLLAADATRDPRRLPVEPGGDP